MKKKGKARGLSLRRNKRFFGFFMVLFTLLVIINATLAWSSYSEWVRNHTQSNPEEVAVDIKEVFEPESVLSYTTDVEKDVTVKNISERDAIIRVKFSESLLPFELDMTDGEGNGNAKVKKITRTTEDFLNLYDLRTWQKGRLLDTTEVDSNNQPLYYKAETPIVSNDYTGESARATGPDMLKLFSWTFDTAVYQTPQPTVNTPYWVYHNGYYYYSQVVPGGDTTTSLLKAVGLSDVNIPNSYKAALYDIEVQAVGVVPSQSGLETWTNDSAILAMYQKDSKFH